MRRKLALISAAAVVATTGAVAVATQAFAASGCSAKYTVVNQWPGGFQGQVDVTNLGDALTSWTVGWDFGNTSQTITQIWNADKTQSGVHVNATNLSWNGNVATNGAISFGFTGNWSGSNPNGTNFTLNGVACTGSTGGSPSPSRTSASPSPSTSTNPTAPTVALTSPTSGSTFTAPATVGLAASATAPGSTVSKVEFYNGATLLGTDTSSPYTFSWANVAAGSYSLTAKVYNAANVTATSAPVSISVTTTGGGGSHVDNPYVGAKVYVNPDWSAKAAAEAGGSRVSNQPTGVWLDSIAAITAPAGSGYATSLRAHLDNALAQGATLAQFVIYDLPGRDCAALASNGELGPTEIDRYKTEYIDPIAAIEADSRYSSIRIVNIIEIDSLPNLVTNADGQAGATSACATMKQNGNYVTGIQYALSKLHAAGTNNYEYIDAAHHGWIGWDTNFGPSAQLFASTAKGAVGGVATVDGFITDTANYSALSEPWIQPSVTINGQTIRQSKWVDWNQYTDELTFAQAFRQQLVSAGFNANIGMLIDTSRNGWGGSARPTAASTSTDINTYVDQSRIDRRIHAGNWCNQSGAGLGERPRATPATGIDAYVWIKPPGESDGSSSLVPTGPNNPGGKGFDRMCDPTYTGNGRNGNSLTGALPNAPISGAWFSAQFQQLMQNAYPAL
ncbi:glycoside hydrolase family 6 protein [Dactylosporangium sp. CA-092794]|uniref:glycoside hydrolase family 6 protein n=1 Tax=Dactylosporangium sp. CA-092794 TaxID=3239929 RepID=UPI003D934098